ncbi:NAD(P)H-quinone oxidoreductase subunit J [Spatholobus suberectus]|nr:NAD(P)H-quinone oxidoreductase subunit J [Spatholobus suberectus]
MQGRLSSWLVKHGLIHRSLGFDYQGIETLQIKPEDWHSIAVILYVYGYNYLRSQCAYDVALGGLLASVYHLMRIEYGIDQLEDFIIAITNPVTSSKSEQVHELANLLREPTILAAAVVVVVGVLAVAVVFAVEILAIRRRREPRLSGAAKPNPARMDPASGAVAEHDRVAAVGDLAGVAVAAAAVAGAEGQRQLCRQRAPGLEVAVDRTEAEELQRNGIDGVEGERNGVVCLGLRFGAGGRFRFGFGFGKRSLEVAGA